MLGETYKRNIAKVKAQETGPVKFIDVTRVNNSPLGPSWQLLNDYKKGNINWKQYTERFINQMNTPLIEAILLNIAKESLEQNVYLVCYEGPGKHCHRYILIELIVNIANKHGIPVQLIK